MRRIILLAAAALLLASTAAAKPLSGFPIDVQITKAPQPVTTLGARHLVYELRLTNFSRSAIEVTRLQVLGPSSPPLADLSGPALESALGGAGTLEDAKQPRLIGSGRVMIAYLNVALPAGAKVPVRLHHRLSLAAQGDTRRVEDTIDGLETAVVTTPAPALAPPLRGSRWLAANALAAVDHRRATVTVDGRTRIAQRFAIDWVQLGADGRLFHGDGRSNADFPGYGADLLAVAPGKVIAIKDGLPDNEGSNTDRAIPITIETLAGNSLLLDIGQGRYALYAHIKPGSFRVKTGDRVKAGQVLALLGNSGNSDAPHLHFQLVDGPSPMGAEGIPYTITAFTQAGVADDPAVLDANAAWTPKAGERPTPHRVDLPENNAVVSFP